MHNSWSLSSSTAVKRLKRFLFYFVGFHLTLSGNMGKDAFHFFQNNGLFLR